MLIWSFLCLFACACGVLYVCCALFCLCVFCMCLSLCVCTCVCVLCRNASPALCCMAGEDWTNENAAESRLISQRTVRWRTDPSAPVSSAWTLRWGNSVILCVYVCEVCVCVCLLCTLDDPCMNFFVARRWDNQMHQCALCVFYSLKCCYNTSPTHVSQTQLEKLHWTLLVNLDVLEWVHHKLHLFQ